ncbi:MAG: phosphatidylglycerophosphatase A [Candidatus Omnitrophota bacterium]
MKKAWLLVATCLNIGRIPLAPGTWGSLATMLLVYFIGPYYQAPLYVQLLIIGMVFLLGIPAANQAERHFGKKDPGQCVIDEVAGQMVTLLAVPHNNMYYVAGFFLFRFFDILKPFPIRKLEKIPGGLGIMIDDIAAGVYASLVLQIGLFLYQKI